MGFGDCGKEDVRARKGVERKMFIFGRGCGQFDKKLN